MIGWIYAVLLLAVVGFIMLRGSREARIVMAALLAGSVNTYLIYTASGADFLASGIRMLLNELAVLVVLLAVAFRSDRFWPLLTAGFQLAAVLALSTPWFGENIVSHGLGVAQGIWAYPQLIVLVMAAARSRTNGHSSPI